jgi:hypothetical protein
MFSEKDIIGNHAEGEDENVVIKPWFWKSWGHNYMMEIRFILGLLQFNLSFQIFRLF